MGADRDGFLRIRWPMATMLYSILAAAIMFGYNVTRAGGEMQATITGMSRDVANLARGVSNLEKRFDVDTQSRYTVTDAAKDYALLNARQSDHEQRLRKLESMRK